MIGQALPKPLKASGIDAANNPGNLVRVRGIQVTQTDHRWSVQAAGREVGIAGLNQLVPVDLKVLKLSANSAQQ
jgi:hypothetical protein